MNLGEGTWHVRTSAVFTFALGKGSRNNIACKEIEVWASYKSEDPDFVSKPSVIKGHLVLFAMH